jgi:hypothetical protein
MPRDRGVSAEIERAEQVAVAALAYLAETPEEMVRFLTLTGVDVGNIRQLARERAFLAAVLGHVTAYEPLLLAFAQSAGIEPARVTRAQTVLAGPAWEREVP